MSSDDKEAKTYNGDKKEDWKAFYDEAAGQQLVALRDTALGADGMRLSLSPSRPLSLSLPLIFISPFLAHSPVHNTACGSVEGR